MHLLDADETALQRIVAVLDAEYGRSRLWPNHCTGERAYARLATAFPGQVAPCPAGTILDF